MSEKYILDSKLGRFASPAMTSAAVILTIVLILAFYQNLNQNIFAGLALLLITGFIVFSKNGICISANTKNYKSYISFLGIKFGKWQQLNGYTDIALLRKTVSIRAFSRANVSAETSLETYFEICLLSPNHRKKLIVARFKDDEIAFDAAHKMAEKLNMKYAEYNPIISDATKAKR
jgi:hypothetical protein